MDRPDTELKKIVDYLETNGYEFEGTISEVIINRIEYPDDAIAYFKKNRIPDENMEEFRTIYFNKI